MYDLIVLRVALLHLFVGQCAGPKESSGLPTKAEVKSFPFEHKQYNEWEKKLWPHGDSCTCSFLCLFMHLFVYVLSHMFDFCFYTLEAQLASTPRPHPRKPGRGVSPFPFAARAPLRPCSPT